MTNEQKRIMMKSVSDPKDFSTVIRLIIINAYNAGINSDDDAERTLLLDNAYKTESYLSDMYAKLHSKLFYDTRADEVVHDELVEHDPQV